VTYHVCRIFIVAIALCLFVLPASEVEARNDSMLQGAHGDRARMPRGCRSCHKGMSIALSGEEKPCLTCHSDSATRNDAVRNGYLDDASDMKDVDIFEEISKPYRHPVVDSQGGHRQLESLPEELPNATRHSECVDCHNVHLVEAGQPYVGISGRMVGNFKTDIKYEYELCYRCHSESANLPADSTNKHSEFKLTNPSYHPVEGEGKNTYVVSLIEPYVAQKEKTGEVSIISCRDCHGSDDPDGPKGPHGSNYPGLLSMNYDMGDELYESDYAYSLCYKCHDRSSILRNESFPYHAKHIQGVDGGQGGTSCFTCHDAHGSTQYQYLIRFNEEVVSENAAGQLRYEAQGYSSRRGACYLNCHGVEHAPKEY
jgi:hypothetical protein